MGNETMDLLKGTLGLLLLKSLQGEARHGHDVMKWLRESSGGTFQVEEGAIYPALHRLEGQGLIESHWGTSRNNRRAKFYQLTGRGRQSLTAETQQWLRYVGTFNQILTTT
jgi:PadR family transcriptional regulator PadR